MKRICVIAMAVIVSASLLVLSCSAAWSGTVSAFDWWDSQTSSCNLFCYSSSGALLSTAVPVNKAAFVSRHYDISPYVSWTSVTSRYISSGYAAIESTFTPLPNGSSMYGIQLQFRDTWKLLTGRTYEFIILRNSIAFYNAAGDPISTGTQVASVSLGGLAMTLEDKYIGTDGYDRAIRCTVTPSADLNIQTISISFKSNYNPTTAASKVILNLALSDVVSYTGDLDSIVVNPTLDNIDRQVDEINDSIKNNPYGEITGSHPDDPFETLDEQDRIDAGDDILNRIQLFLEGIPANVSTFWKQIVEFLFALPIFLPFITLGVGFIFMRMLLGR